MRLLIVNCILIALVYATVATSGSPKSSENSSRLTSSSMGTDPATKSKGSSSGSKPSSKETDPDTKSNDNSSGSKPSSKETDPDTKSNDNSSSSKTSSKGTDSDTESNENSGSSEPCSKETDSDTKSTENSGSSKPGSQGTDSDDPKYKIVINIKDITEEGGSSSESSKSSSDRRCPACARWNRRTGRCQCKFGGKFPKCCRTKCAEGQTCNKHGNCVPDRPDCKHPNKACFNDDTNKCECIFDGTFPKCCSDCSAVAGQKCCKPGMSCESESPVVELGDCFCPFGDYTDAGTQKCCSDCSAVVGQICCKPGMSCESVSVKFGDCFCENGEKPIAGPIQCCPEPCSVGESCDKDGICGPEGPVCDHPNGAYYDFDEHGCLCRFDGAYPDCCPSCSTVPGQICCQPEMDCESALVGECFCQNGEIPKNGPIECCTEECEAGEACNANGICAPVIPFGGKCSDGGIRSSNACDRKAGIKCHTYDCCQKPGDNIKCSEKYCLCETPRGWVYNNETVLCAYEGGRPDKQLCLDAPVNWVPTP